jgi:hypothetical protein
MDLGSWAGSVNLQTPAGVLLQKLADVLPQNLEISVTVFGSAPIQITIDSTLTSADVDVFSDFEHLEEIVDRSGLAESKSPFFVQVSSELNFRASARWRDRAQRIRIRNCTFVFPHPIDILIAKLSRLDEKDLRAFEIVRAKTGHPTEQELIAELQMAVDLFRPSFNEEQGQDMAANCRRLWLHFYGRDVDVRNEIIAPALAKRKAGYGEPSGDHKQELRDALKSR